MMLCKGLAIPAMHRIASTEVGQYSQVRAAVDALLCRAAEKACNAHCLEMVAAARASGWQQHSPPAAPEATAGSPSSARAEPGQGRAAAGGAAGAPAAPEAAAGSPGCAHAAPCHTPCEPAHAPEPGAERAAASGGAGEAGGAARAQVFHKLHDAAPFGAGEGGLTPDQSTAAAGRHRAVPVVGSPDPDPRGRAGLAPAGGSAWPGAAAAGEVDLLAGSLVRDIAAAAGAASDSEDSLELVGPWLDWRWCMPLRVYQLSGVLSSRLACRPNRKLIGQLKSSCLSQPTHRACAGSGSMLGALGAAP